MTALPDQFRLLIFVAVQLFILFAAWRFVSRFVASRLQRAIDALLLTYLIQYLAVGLPGMAGLLSPTAMLAMAGLMALTLLLAKKHERKAKDEGGRMKDEKGLFPFHPSSFILLPSFLFVIGYVAAYAWQQRYLPILATDALTYHFPAAVQWLQRGRIDLFQTWFFNPANTYSPLAGSIFIAWLLGPIGNDSLAHFAPAPMVGLIFLAVVGLVRSLARGPAEQGDEPASDEAVLSSRGVTLTAVLAGLAVVLARPIVSQIDKGKDDLFLAAFFAVAAGALSPRRLRDPLGPWRLGIAVGLCLAVKYTALLALPMLLLAADAPVRARWRWKQWLAAIACAAAIAGPWYLRNLRLTGNPLFPADFLGLHGLLSTARSLELRSVAGVLGVLNSGAFAVPGALGVLLLIGWLTGLTTHARGAKSDPLARLVTLGPVLGLAVFVFTSPYPEIRFLVPAMILVAGSVGRIGTFGLGIAFAAAVASAMTGLGSPLWATQLDFCLTGAVLATVGVGIVFLQMRWLRWRPDVWLGIAGVIALLAAGWAYVGWSAFLGEREYLTYQAWAGDGRVNLWAYVRDQIPAGETIAYTGTFEVYPLMGYRLDRPVVYAPVRPGMKTIADLPRLGDHLAGEQIQPAAMAATIGGPDRSAWLANLRSSGAKHLIVFTQDAEASPVELTWAQSMPEMFQPEYADGAGAVFKIVDR